MLYPGHFAGADSKCGAGAGGEGVTRLVDSYTYMNGHIYEWCVRVRVRVRFMCVYLFIKLHVTRNQALSS